MKLGIYLYALVLLVASGCKLKSQSSSLQDDPYPLDTLTSDRYDQEINSLPADQKVSLREQIIGDDSVSYQQGERERQTLDSDSQAIVNTFNRTSIANFTSREKLNYLSRPPTSSTQTGWDRVGELNQLMEQSPARDAFVKKFNGLNPDQQGRVAYNLEWESAHYAKQLKSAQNQLDKNMASGAAFHKEVEDVLHYREEIFRRQVFQTGPVLKAGERALTRNASGSKAVKP